MLWKKLIFTGLYTGYSPVAPGTAGTVLALLIYVLEYYAFGEISWVVNLAIVVLFLYRIKYRNREIWIPRSIPSIRICDSSIDFYKKDDPQEVVIDEIFGYWVSVLFYPFSWKIALLGFIFFRIFDIFKPYPVKNAENLHGGTGIMMDDILAGIYSNLSILCLILIGRYTGFPVL